MKTERTQVGIVGSGPSGLLLSHLLSLEGIDSVIVERQTREHVEARIRAGVLEQSTVDLLRSTGVADRLNREALVHEGFDIALDGERHRIDLKGLTGGKCVFVYGQTELTKDLIGQRLADSGRIDFGCDDVVPRDVKSNAPSIHYRLGDEERELRCDWVAGCDGFHGVCRTVMPGGLLNVYETVYPYAWLGILAEVPPPSEELIYARHQRGFALFSMRSEHVSRAYLQCEPNEDLEQWSDQRVWDELAARLGHTSHALKQGPVVDKSVTAMRSFVAEPMRFGRLFLAGDAAHIVPPTGAKGLNLAAADVAVLARAFIQYYRHGDERELEQYSDKALARIWRAQSFSRWMTLLLHPRTDGEAFERRVEQAQLEVVLQSDAAMTALAENYVGLPFE